MKSVGNKSFHEKSSSRRKFREIKAKKKLRDSFFLPAKQAKLFALRNSVMPAMRIMMTTKTTMPITGPPADSAIKIINNQ